MPAPFVSSICYQLRFRLDNNWNSCVMYSDEVLYLSTKEIRVGLIIALDNNLHSAFYLYLLPFLTVVDNTYTMGLQSRWQYRSSMSDIANPPVNQVDIYYWYSYAQDTASGINFVTTQNTTLASHTVLYTDLDVTWTDAYVLPYPLDINAVTFSISPRVQYLNGTIRTGIFTQSYSPDTLLSLDPTPEEEA